MTPKRQSSGNRSFVCSFVLIAPVWDLSRGEIRLLSPGQSNQRQWSRAAFKQLICSLACSPRTMRWNVCGMLPRQLFLLLFWRLTQAPVTHTRPFTFSSLLDLLTPKSINVFIIFAYTALSAQRYGVAGV